MKKYTLEELAEETKYLQRLARNGNTFAVFHKTASRIEKMVKLMFGGFEDSFVTTWFQATIRGFHDVVDDLTERSSFSEVAIEEFDRYHRMFMWYFRNVVAGEEEYLKVIRLYREASRVVSKGSTLGELFQKRTKIVQKRLDKVRKGIEII